jgi:phospholipid/cholesterol/gamma-HCH transport system substrate-binding protein
MPARRPGRGDDVNERQFRIVTGLIAVLLGLAAVFFGIKASSGALASKYRLLADFTAAGQGLQEKSDVKIHGVNIGQVKRVRLVNGQAEVSMDISSDQKVPVASKATIRPKTLFGEKFVDIDPGTAETTGPFLKNEGHIADTLGGFELEQVLADVYPILKAIKPEDLLVVLDTLAQAGQGEGPAINRQIQNFQKVADVQANHNADTAQFLTDLAKLSDELDKRAADVIGGAVALNDALPALNSRSDELSTALRQASRLSSDVADVLEANQPFLQKNVTENGRTLQNLYDHRAQIGPLVIGLREYFEIQAEAVRIPFGDGTMLAAIKLVLGEDCPTGRDLDRGGCLSTPGPSTGSSPAGPAGGAGVTQTPAPPSSLPPVSVPPLPLQGSKAVQQLLGGLLP